MIARLEGEVTTLRPGEVIVDAGGVGYLVRTTLSDLPQLGAGRARLWIHTVVRADQIALYGFLEQASLTAFERLIAVSGVGPKTALALLSGMSAGELASAIDAGEAGRLQRVPGIGKKTAQRIVLELKDRLDLEPSLPNTGADALSALVNLGYPERDAKRAVADARADHAGAELGELLRLALQRLSR